MKIIQPDDIAPPAGAYSHAFHVGSFLFLAGEVAFDPDGSVAGVGDVAAQTRKTIENMSTVLEAAGFTLSDVVQTTAYLTDMANFPTFDAVYREMFGDHRPPRATVTAELARPELLVEIQAIAMRE